MVLGMSLQTFTLLHTAISLVGIGTGLIVVWGMLTGNRFDGWTAIFLLTTILTSATGFLFPVPLSPLLPSQIVGFISLAVLLLTLLALYVFKLAGFWRWVYVGGALLALYLNVFVAVVQSFLKIGFLHALAPTQAVPGGPDRGTGAVLRAWRHRRHAVPPATRRSLGVRQLLICA